MKIEDLLNNQNLAPFLDALKPYLPALVRMTQAEVELFIASVLRNEWPEADALVVANMTRAERDALADEAKRLAFDAAMKQFENREVAKEIALKLLIALGIAAGGLIRGG